MKPVSSWGRLSADIHDVIALPSAALAPAQVQAHAPGLAYGNGRSYGDVCLNPGGVLWATRGMDRLISFDAVTGVLRCEAGVLLREIQRLMIPRGWMLPVTPGTQLVTVGGAIANDVHGKNHHARGSFGDHVRALSLVRTDGERIDCGPRLRPDWFGATVGGMGLTGVILHADLALVPVAGPWLDTETIPFDSLDQFFTLADGSEAQWEHTVAWIDCLSTRGRGVFMRANPAAAAAEHGAPAAPPRQSRFPFTPPVSLVNRLTLGPFNHAYYQLAKWRAGPSRVHYEPFFYPLDKLSEWNRLYGPRGFYQYQCVVPRTDGAAVVRALLDAIAGAGEGSFLAVLKTFGERPPVGWMSFPQPGVTLALDFPNRGAATLALLARLDGIVADAGGRLYAAKDARMPRALFEAGYPRLPQFLSYRDAGISSAMSRRLMAY